MNAIIFVFIYKIANLSSEGLTELLNSNRVHSTWHSVIHGAIGSLALQMLANDSLVVKHP